MNNFKSENRVSQDHQNVIDALNSLQIEVYNQIRRIQTNPKVACNLNLQPLLARTALIGDYVANLKVSLAVQESCQLKEEYIHNPI